jgi:hypothetical protein
MIAIDLKALASALAAELNVEQAGSPWMRIANAADYMCCSESWMYDRLAEIPHVKVDRKLLFNRHQLDRWLTNYRQGV